MLQSPPLLLLSLLLLHLLLGLQAIDLANKILEDDAALRSNALLELVNDLLGRLRPSATKRSNRKKR
jgi:hypothetical protein